MYLRLHPIQAVQGLLFGMGQPQANEWAHRLTLVLNAALGHQKQLSASQPLSTVTLPEVRPSSSAMA